MDIKNKALKDLIILPYDNINNDFLDKVFYENSLQIIYVVRQKELYGIITEGDYNRHLEGKQGDLIRTKFTFFYEADLKQAKRILIDKTNKINRIPIVGKNKELIYELSVEEDSNSLNNQKREEYIISEDYIRQLVILINLHNIQHIIFVYDENSSHRLEETYKEIFLAGKLVIEEKTWSEVSKDFNHIDRKHTLMVDMDRDLQLSAFRSRARYLQKNKIQYMRLAGEHFFGNLHNNCTYVLNTVRKFYKVIFIFGEIPDDSWHQCLAPDEESHIIVGNPIEQLQWDDKERYFSYKEDTINPEIAISLNFFLTQTYLKMNGKKVPLLSLQSIYNPGVALFTQLRNLDTTVQAQIFEQLLNDITKQSCTFKEKIYIASLLVFIHGGDVRLAEFIITTLLEDEKYREFHYEIFINLFFYIRWDGVPMHKDYYLQKRKLIDKVSRWVIDKENLLVNKYQKVSKKIVIVTDVLYSILHSPTKIMLDYAKNIIKYYPEYEVKIFVEESFYCSNKDRVLPYLHQAQKSERYQEEHKRYLDHPSIEIYYSDLNKEMKTRTLEIVKKIEEFGPQMLLTNNKVSIAANILYSYVPVIYMNMGGPGGEYFSNKADVYLCSDRERVMGLNHIYNLLEENRVYDFQVGLEFMEPTKIIRRNDLKIEEDDFVMVTVGNRLHTEMDEEFIRYVMSFVLENNKIKWLIVGCKYSSYLETEYSSLIGDKVIKIEYESDLPALYRICNVYLNPRRKGGGISIAMAMNEGLPIVLTKDSADGVYHVGKENTSIDDMEGYILELSKIYCDKTYAEERKAVSKKRMKERGMEAGVEYLIQKANGLNEVKFPR